MKKKKVAIVGTVGLPPRYGGFETLAYYLTLKTSSLFSYTVFCQKTPRKQRIKKFNNSRLFYLPFKANGCQSIVYDVVSLFISWFKYDTILILGTPGCIILPFLNLFKKTKTIVNFGGLEWKRDKWNRFILFYLKQTEKIAIKHATHIVADNQYFSDYIQTAYKKESFLIEYGGDHVLPRAKTQLLIDKYPFLNTDYDVSISRAQPDNNLHLLLEAYAKHPKRNIVLISNYNVSKYGRKLKLKFAKYPNIFMQDAIYSQSELDVIRSNANVYIHSHTFCGTAPSLVETMSLGLPVLAFDMPTNRYTTEDQAYYFKDSEELCARLKSLNDAELILNGQKMKKIAESRYRWDIISEKYSDLF